MKALWTILFNSALVAALVGSTFEGYEAFGTFAIGIIWLSIVGVVIAGLNDDLTSDLRKLAAEKGVVYKVLSYPIDVVVTIALILAGYPVTAVFYVMAIFAKWAIVNNK